MILLGPASACQRLPELTVAGDRPAADAGPVLISGPWRFYPEQFCTGPDCRGDGVENPPLLWRDGDHPRISGLGYGTYITTVAKPTAWRGVLLGIHMFDVGTAYRVVVNDRVRGGNGKIATEPGEAYRPELHPRIVQFETAEDEIRIALQIANFSHPRGGLRRAPVLGPLEAVQSNRELANVRGILLLGLILGMAFYHFGLFLSRRADTPAAVFGIFCLTLTVRMLYTDEVLIRLWIPEQSYWWQTTIEYLTFILGGPLFATFLAVTYPFRRWKYFILPLYALFACAALFILATPVTVYARFLTYFQLVTLLSVVVCLIIWGKALRAGRPGALASLAGGAAACAGAINDILYAQRLSPFPSLFQYGFLIFILAQSYLLARLFAVAYESAQRLSENLKSINTALSRFVPRQFLKYLQRQDITEINLGDQVQKRMTVMFADIRSFTALSEQMSPAENFNFLNSYLGRMTPIVNGRGGFIDKYIGDGVMALFPRRSDEALKAAIEMQRELRVYNRHRANRGYDPISIGIGLHVGDIMLGIIGNETRMEGTVISDAVNTASRVEGLTRRYGAVIIASDALVDSLEKPEDFERRRLGIVRVKGKKRSFSVHHILNGYTDEIRELFLNTRDRFHEAVDLAHSSRLSEAARIFEEIVAANPMDQAARFYIERIERHAKTRPL